MTAPGNGTHAVAPGFEGARITPEQADALAASFVPSWESNGAAPAHPVAMAVNGGDLRATMKSNGVHAESHAPPQRTRVSEPEDSVVIDRSITADQISPPPASSRRLAVAAPYVAPAVAPPPPAPPPPASLHPVPPPQPERQVRTVPPARPVGVAARSPSVDDEYRPKSKKGLFIGIGVGAAAALAIGIAVVASGGDANKASETPVPTITVVKTDETSKIPPPPPPTQSPAATATPIAAATTPATPVTALPTAPPDSPPPKPRSAHAPTSQQPAYNTPVARPQPPRSGGGGSIVKDVPF